jgi:hypothetical protein
MALELDAAPDQVQMPGYFSGSVATASDDQLADQLQNSLDVIADQLSQWGTRPTREGYAPKGWLEQANASRPMHSAESAVRRNERMARAIRREQIDRVERAKAEREADIANARDRLGRIVKDAPHEAQRAVAHAQEVIAASERIRQTVADLRLMGGSTGLASQIDRLRDGAAIAADRLGQPAPDMPGTPDGLPTKTEVAAVLAAFLGRGGFDATFTPYTEAGKADDLSRKLKRLKG